MSARSGQDTVLSASHTSAHGTLGEGQPSTLTTSISGDSTASGPGGSWQAVEGLLSPRSRSQDRSPREPRPRPVVVAGLGVQVLPLGAGLWPQPGSLRDIPRLHGNFRTPIPALGPLSTSFPALLPPPSLACPPLTAATPDRVQPPESCPGSPEGPSSTRPSQAA